MFKLIQLIGPNTNSLGRNRKSSDRINRWQTLGDVLQKTDMSSVSLAFQLSRRDNLEILMISYALMVILSNKYVLIS